MYLHTQTKINKLSQDTYDYLLREAGDFTDPADWYEIAIAVADHLKAEVINSRNKTAPLFCPKYKPPVCARLNAVTEPVEIGARKKLPR